MRYEGDTHVIVVGPQKYCNGERNQNFENSRETIVFFVVSPDLFINGARAISGQLFRKNKTRTRTTTKNKRRRRHKTKQENELGYGRGRRGKEQQCKT